MTGRGRRVDKGAMTNCEKHYVTLESLSQHHLQSCPYSQEARRNGPRFVKQFLSFV